MTIDWSLIGKISTALMPILLTFIGWTLHQLSVERQQQREWLINIQPLLHRLAVRLVEVKEVVERLESDEWTQAYGRYESIPAPDKLSELSDEAAAISVAAGVGSRRLAKALDEFRDLVEHLEEEGWQRALEIRLSVASQQAEERDLEDFQYLAWNQEFHAWREGRNAIADQVWTLSEELERHALSDETKRVLRGIRATH